MIAIGLTGGIGSGKTTVADRFQALGAIIGSIGLWIAKKGVDTRIPFGPYLALGGIVGLFWGRESVMAWLGRFPV